MKRTYKMNEQNQVQLNEHIGAVIRFYQFS